MTGGDISCIPVRRRLGQRSNYGLFWVFIFVELHLLEESYGGGGKRATEKSDEVGIVLIDWVPKTQQEEASCLYCHKSVTSSLSGHSLNLPGRLSWQEEGETLGSPSWQLTADVA